MLFHVNLVIFYLYLCILYLYLPPPISLPANRLLLDGYALLLSQNDSTYFSYRNVYILAGGGRWTFCHLLGRTQRERVWSIVCGKAYPLHDSKPAFKRLGIFPGLREPSTAARSSPSLSRWLVNIFHYACERTLAGCYALSSNLLSRWAFGKT